MNYYNEFDPNAAAWLRQLIAEGLIPPGHVDQRSITDVTPTELSGYTQCHFFCGIGGWSLALALAGWPADRPVWTGSCPCQPFSVAGKGKGADDERHLWPAFFNLIRECRPQHVFGEQVESAIAHGWLDGIRADLEGEGYACGDATLGAHSVTAPHIRQRLYWVADAQNSDRRGEQPARRQGSGRGGFTGSGTVGRMADSIRPGLEGYRWHGDHGHESRWNGTQPIGSTAPCCAAGAGLGDAEGRGCGIIGHETQPGRSGYPDGASLNPWADSIWIPCRDGKHRRIPTEPALFPLADGLPYKLARRGSVRPALLKGAGNAIVPQVAAAFITAFLES